MSEHAFPPGDRDAVYRAIETRRDVRSYRPEPVPAATLHRVLTAAHHAPSVGFMQPWNFLLVEDAALRRRVHAHVLQTSDKAGQTYEGDRARTYQALKLQGILDAPLNVLVTCDSTRGGNVLGRHTMRETDAYSTCLAVQNLWLAARAEGLGVGWVSILEPSFLREIFGIPEHVLIIAYLTLGYPVELPEQPMLQAVGWRQRLSLDELIFRDRWEERADLAVSPALSSGLASGLTGAPAPVTEQLAPEPAASRNARLTKPPGSLGRLEAVAMQVAAVQGGAYPRASRKAVLLLAGDHGITAEGVSAYQPHLTARMIVQFAAGAGAVNAFARQVGATLYLGDLGVDHDFGQATGIAHHKIRRGTRNFAHEPAMTALECAAAMHAGASMVPDCDLLAIGEMGIGNSTSAAAIVAAILGLPAELVVGRGTGVGDRTWERKVAVVRDGLMLHCNMDPLIAFGGYEIAGLVGAIIEAARRRIPVVLDGFITGAAALVAVQRDPAARETLIAGHRSAEAGHQATLDALSLVPLLDLGLRLGEGSGATLALGLIEAACRTLSEMRTFEEAGIDEALAPGGRR